MDSYTDGQAIRSLSILIIKLLFLGLKYFRMFVKTYALYRYIFAFDSK